MKGFVFILLFWLTNLSYSQDSTIWITKYFKGSDQIQEKYQVLKSDTSIKNGEYYCSYKSLKKGHSHFDIFVKAKGFYKNGAKDSLWNYWNKPKVRRWINEISIYGSFNSEGKYKNGVKTGVWKYESKDNEVTLNYNHNNNKYDQPNIFVHPKYNNEKIYSISDSLNGDEIIIEYEIDSNCNLINYKVVKTIHESIDISAINALKRKLNLIIKYRNKGAECIAGKHEETFFYEY